LRNSRKGSGPKHLAQARETTAANTAAAAPSLDLVHAGVLLYLREIDVVR
jgi:hypothetical protein